MGKWRGERWLMSGVRENESFFGSLGLWMGGEGAECGRLEFVEVVEMVAVGAGEGDYGRR